MGFPSSKPAINPNHCYFFIAEGTFRTLHGGSSTTHISPSPFRCVQHPLPFQSPHRDDLTPPDTAAAPWHGFLRYFVSATSFRKPEREESSKPASPEGRWELAGWVVLRFKAEHSGMSSALLSPSPGSCGHGVSCDRWMDYSTFPSLSGEQELFSHHSRGDAGRGATIRAGAPALASSPSQLPSSSLLHTHSQILIVSLWVPKPGSLTGLFITDMIRCWAEKIPSEVAFISADSEWTRYVS